MRRRTVFVLGVVLVLTMACRQGQPETRGTERSPAPEVAQAGAVEWETSWDVAFELARDEEKLVVVDFYAEWSAWSVHMAGSVLREPSVRQALSKLSVPLRLNVDGDGRDLVREHGVEHLPTLAIFAEDGRELDRLVGVHRAEAVVEAIESSSKLLANAGHAYPDGSG